MWRSAELSIDASTSLCETGTWSPPESSTSFGVTLPRLGAFHRRTNGQEHIVDRTTGFFSRVGEVSEVAHFEDRVHGSTTIEVDPDHGVSALAEIKQARGPFVVGPDMAAAHHLLVVVARAQRDRRPRDSGAHVRAARRLHHAGASRLQRIDTPQEQQRAPTARRRRVRAPQHERADQPRRHRRHGALLAVPPHEGVPLDDRDHDVAVPHEPEAARRARQAGRRRHEPQRHRGQRRVHRPLPHDTDVRGQCRGDTVRAAAAAARRSDGFTSPDPAGLGSAAVRVRRRRRTSSSGADSTHAAHRIGFMSRCTTSRVVHRDMNCPTRRWVASGAWPPRRFPFRSAPRHRRSSYATREARSRRSAGSPPMPGPSWSHSSATTARTSSTSARRSRCAPANGRARGVAVVAINSNDAACVPGRLARGDGAGDRRARVHVPVPDRRHAGGRQGVRRRLHARPVPVRRRSASRLPRPVRRHPARQRDPRDGGRPRRRRRRRARGTPMPADQRPSVGCSIKWKPGNEPA